MPSPIKHAGLLLVSLFITSLFTSCITTSKGLAKDPFPKEMKNHRVMTIFDNKRTPEDYLGSVFEVYTKDKKEITEEVIERQVWDGTVRETGGMYERIAYDASQVFQLNARLSGLKGLSFGAADKSQEEALDEAKKKFKDKKEELERQREKLKDMEREDAGSGSIMDEYDSSEEDREARKDKDAAGGDGAVTLDILKLQSGVRLALKLINIRRVSLVLPVMKSDYRTSDSLRNREFIHSVLIADIIALEVFDDKGVNIGATANMKGISVSAKYEQSEHFNGFKLAENAVFAYRTRPPMQEDLDRE
ncbi:MAG: hypothetical protein JW838_04890 [Spirochaetes bacterium]|nr:hypothetical protein [Spirochaetota bacterium]